MRPPTIVRLQDHGYHLTVDPAHGASLLSLRWQKPDGAWFDILHPCPPAEAAGNGGCFVMAPFANRLEAGRFETPDGTVIVPLNRQEQGMAIHGFSRDRAWRVAEGSSDGLVLVDDFADPASAFAYRLVQEISVGPAGVQLSLTLANRAGRTLPYGFGFHPWFRKDDTTWLTVAAQGVLGRDIRGFPTGVIAGPDFASGVDAATMHWFDGHLVGWNARRAVIEWRNDGVALELSASGALTNLHVYVPDDRPVLCVEPVSHVPDVHNRRHLAGHGDLTWLAPGETMTGAMTLSATSMD